jgi:hypothetical protein
MAPPFDGAFRKDGRVSEVSACGPNRMPANIAGDGPAANLRTYRCGKRRMRIID